MTLSTNYSFDLSRDNVINLALTNIGVIPPGGTPSAEHRELASRWLNVIVKSLDEDGKFTWRVRDKTIPLVAGTASYALGGDVVDVSQVFFVRPGETTRIVLAPMTSVEYRKLPDLTTAGTPTQYWAERNVGTPGFTAYLWPVPDAAAAGSIVAQTSVRGMDYTLGSNTGDFPQGWLMMLIFGLTAMLGPAFGQTDAMATYGPLYQSEKDKVINADVEDVPLRVVPWGY